jgi:hypothetical protein
MDESKTRRARCYNWSMVNKTPPTSHLEPPPLCSGVIRRMTPEYHDKCTAQRHRASSSTHKILPAPVVIGAQRIEFLQGKHQIELENGAESIAPNDDVPHHQPASAVSAAAPAAATAAAYHAAAHFECDSGMVAPVHVPATLANCWRRLRGRRGMQNRWEH